MDNNLLQENTDTSITLVTIERSCLAIGRFVDVANASDIYIGHRQELVPSDVHISRSSTSQSYQIHHEELVFDEFNFRRHRHQ